MKDDPQKFGLFVFIVCLRIFVFRCFPDRTKMYSELDTEDSQISFLDL